MRKEVDKKKTVKDDLVNNNINISQFIPHPKEPDTFIGRIDRTGKGSFRGLYFERPVTLAEIQRGKLPETKIAPLIRSKRRPVVWAITHLFETEHGLLDTQGK